MKYQGIIFDLDGVICSTDKYHYMAWKSIADKVGIAFDEESNNQLRGVSRMESLEILLSKEADRFTLKEKIVLAEEKNQYYQELLKKLSPADLTSEVKATLDQIKQMGILIAIGSSSKNAKFILKQIGLEDYFNQISDGTNITHSKPDPEVFLLASEYLHLPTGECLVVEDALSGIEAATLAGMDSAAIGNASHHSPATYHLDRFQDLIQYL